MERTGHLTQYWPIALLIVAFWMLPRPTGEPWGNWVQTDELRWRYRCQELSQPPRLLITHQLQNISKQIQAVELFSLSNDAIAVTLQPQQTLARRQEIEAGVCPQELEVNVRTTSMGTPPPQVETAFKKYEYGHSLLLHQ